MGIFAFCALGVVSAAAALLLRRTNPQISLLISVAAGVMILLGVTREIVLSAEEVSAILTAGGIGSDNIMILLKALGISFVTEFTCDTVTEAGMISLSSNLSLAGKVLILVTALPLLRDILGIISGLVSAV